MLHFLSGKKKKHSYVCTCVRKTSHYIGSYMTIERNENKRALFKETQSDLELVTDRRKACSRFSTDSNSE